MHRLGSSIGHKLRYLSSMDGRAIPYNPKLTFDLLAQMLEKSDAIGTGQHPITDQGIQLALHRNGAHHRQVIVTERRFEHRCLPARRIGPDQGRDQIETGFGLQIQLNNHPRTPFFKGRPDLHTPLLDGRFVALAGRLDRQLGPPVQRFQPAPDVCLMVLYLEFFANDFGHWSTGP